jgi:hypothetical protein
MRSMVEGASAAAMSGSAAKTQTVETRGLAAAAAPSTACGGPPPPLRG